MRWNRFSRWTLALLGAVFLTLSSCETLKFAMLKDDQLVAGGVDAWNAGKIDSAQAYWNAIKDPTLRTEWLGRVDQYNALELRFDQTAALPASPEAPILAAWDATLKDFKDFPDELKLPDTLLNRLVPVAKTIVQGRIADEKIVGAKAFMKTASDTLGNRVDWTPELDAIQEYEAAQATASSFRALDRSLSKTTTDAMNAARNEEDFDQKIQNYESAITTYTKAENTMAAQAKSNGYKESSPLYALVTKYRTGRAAARSEMERTLRGRATDFKERIGGEFARTPDELGSSNPGDIVKFYEGIKTNIDAMQAEVVSFAGKYPKVIDQDMLKDVDAQKRDLEARIVVVTAEWRKAQQDAKIAAELASRGKPVLPLLIGLFNPQPGTKGDSAKSRPAKFKGNFTKDTEYWWGMVEIPKGTYNDLVITGNEGETVRVFSENTLSGKEIDRKKLKDLVSRSNKSGNSWPVLNAGAQLASGKYFFELGKNKDAKYTGDVVVYSSFIVRFR